MCLVKTVRICSNKNLYLNRYFKADLAASKTFSKTGSLTYKDLESWKKNFGLVINFSRILIITFTQPDKKAYDN